MEKQIIALLECTLEEYQQRKFQTYWNWCMHNSTSPVMTQKLLANSAVSNWFNIEHAKLEQQFLEATFLKNRHIGFRSGWYKGCIADIFTKFPKPLIDACSHINKDYLNNLVTNTPNFYAN